MKNNNLLTKRKKVNNTKSLAATYRRNFSQVNEHKRDYRSFTVIGAFVLAFVILTCSLFNVQLASGKDDTSVVVRTKTRTLTVSGSRGRILDTNGIPLAIDQKCYNIVFYREYNTVAQREYYTNSIIRAITILEENGISIEQKFAINSYVDENGSTGYKFDWGNVSQETAEKREYRWRSDFYFDVKAKVQKTPEEMYFALRTRYKIPDDMPDEMAFKVLGIWQDSIQNYYYSTSIIVARKLDDDTIAKFESYSYELPGFSVIETTERVYPQYETAAHIVGYMGKINSDNYDMFVNELGYSVDDYVGVYGIESAMERYLTGNGSARNGKRVVETTADGTILRDISYTYPKNGDDVYLTIDINMQKIAENALEQNIAAIHEQQVAAYEAKPEKYQTAEEKIGRKLKMAETGAVVVLNVKDAAVLAMASYPSYDPNIFAMGITQDALDELFSDSRAVLVNKAISSASTPGSIFKMCVGAAGLMEGVLGIKEEIEDLGEFKKYTDANHVGPRCWRWRDSHRTHGPINVEEALMHSCNYFFYEVADRLGIDNIRKWAYNFGLITKTNIELSNEVSGQVGNQEYLYDVNKNIYDQQTSLPLIVYRSIKNTILSCAKASNVTIDEERLESAILRMMKLIGLPSRKERLTEIRTILVSELELRLAYVDSETKYHVCDYVEELIWTPIKTVNSGIGQGITTLTPIAVARYIASIVNGGYVYDTHIVDRVMDSAGNVVFKTEAKVFNQLGINDEYLAALKKGMRDVVSGEESSTAKKYFDDFKYKTDMGGKTGTAQVNDYDLENNSWFVAFAPYDNPEIVIVTCIPNGLAGAMSSITVKAIVEYYLDKKNLQENNIIPVLDGIYNS